MDLERIFQNAGPMDAQNTTLFLLSLIAQLGNRTKKAKSVTTANNSTEDEDLLLALNISEMLMKYNNDDPTFWETVVSNLEEEEIRRKEEANRRLSPTTSNVLIIVYMLVIGMGTFGNLLVIAAVARQPALRSRRNAIIINLAVSDLLLCLMTMPLTLIEVINGHWPLGDSEWSCKASGGFQALSVFVSTISITVIALDRYQLIIYPTKDVLGKIGVAAGIFFIWSLGFFLASPIFVFRTLEHYELDDQHHKGEETRSGRGVHSIDYCYEKWPIKYGRAIYSTFTLLIQYAVPIIIISVLHSQICHRLRSRHSTSVMMGSTTASHRNTQRQIEEEKRLRRRHHLLMAISITFLITWLPLNVLNLLLDLYNPFTLPRDDEIMRITYAVCHLFGMSSACANPFLYGWFNDNFRGEFKLILTAHSRCCASFNVAGQRSRPSSIQMALHSDVISTLEQRNRVSMDIGNKNSTFDGPEQTEMSTLKEMRVDFESDQHEITMEEPISTSSSSREILLVPKSDTTDSSNFPKTKAKELPTVVVSILQSSSNTLETYL